MIVPLYNKARYVERCLESIFSQSFVDFEIIVVDDGSTDDGAERVRRYRDQRLRLLSQANSGPGSARNRGARAAEGSVLAFLDADDAWDPDYLAESVRRLDACGQDVASITWGMVEYPQGLSTEARWRIRGIPEGVYQVTRTTSVSLLVSMVAEMAPSSTVVRKGVLEQLGGFYERNRCLYSEDAWLWLKILLHHRVAFFARPLVRKYNDASELSRNLAAVRPIEPFLVEPEEIEDECPSHLAELLRGFLAARAAKTATVYGYWGRWREARSLMKRFCRLQDWRHPYFLTGLAASTRLGARVASVIRVARYLLR